LGFRDVYDYAGGKQDWLAAGLPIEGTLASIPRAGDVARKDAPTCRMDERLGVVKQRVRGAGWEACVVTNEQRVVMGLLRSKELDRDEDLTIDRAMRPGPSTFRRHVLITEMADYMGRHGLESSPITTADGRLVGILLREDAERVAHELHQATHEHEEMGSPNP
jgi:predicted transcriptional regulator